MSNPVSELIKLPEVPAYSAVFFIRDVVFFLNLTNCGKDILGLNLITELTKACVHLVFSCSCETFWCLSSDSASQLHGMSVSSAVM